jgi:hypothetical protein
MIDKGHAAMLDNRRMIIRELSDELGLSFGFVQPIMTEDLGRKCVSVKFVSKLLTVEQKATHLAVARDLLQCADQDANFLKTVITCDKSWVQGTTWKQKLSQHNGCLRVFRDQTRHIKFGAR